MRDVQKDFETLAEKYEEIMIENFLLKEKMKLLQEIIRIILEEQPEEEDLFYAK